MGHSQSEKLRSRERILDIASRCFRRMGLDGLSIADLMKEAGLTHGGFYKHFASREDLVASAVDRAMLHTLERPATSLTSLIDNYLSPAHRDAAATGCAISALAVDVGRANGACRKVFTAHLRASLDRMAGLASVATQSSDEDAMFRLSAMVGALVLARAVDDPNLSGELMEATRKRLQSPDPKPVRRRRTAPG